MMKMLSGLALAAAFAVLPPAQQAAAQVACGERTMVLKDLEQRFGEARGASGITQSGGLLEITVAPSGSWTVLLTLPGQPACVVAVGQEWQFMPGSIGAVGISAPMSSRVPGLR